MVSLRQYPPARNRDGRTRTRSQVTKTRRSPDRPPSADRPALRRALAATALAVSLAGCVSLRLHDEGRQETAKEAVAIAAELATPADDPFAAMEANVQTVAAAQARTNSLLADQRRQSLFDDLDEIDRGSLLDELTVALDDHLQALAAADRRVTEAAAAIQQQLQRGAAISRAAGDPAPTPLAAALEAVEDRLAEVEKAQVDIARALAVLNRIDPTGDRRRIQAAADASSEVQAAVDGINELLGSIRSDARLVAAKQLLMRSGQQIAQAEQRRLAELRRYLAGLQATQRELESRSLYVLRSLVLPALVQVATAEEMRQRLASVERAQLPADLATRIGDEVLSIYLDGAAGDEARALDREIAQRIDTLQDRWASHPTLVDFVSAGIAENERQGIEAMKLVGSLGLVLLVESGLDQQALIDLDRQTHLHSIRLSQINAQERLELVHQVAQALEVYYQGGLTPAQVAQAILLGSQVLATGYIGVQL